MPDVIFSPKETAYLGSQRLARIATEATALSSSSPSSSEGFIQPDVVPVGFDFDGWVLFFVNGMNLLKSTKYQNAQKIPRVALE